MEVVKSSGLHVESTETYSGVDITSHLESSAEVNFYRRTLETGLLVDKYYTPLLCLLGAFGNSLSLVVFCMDAKYRRQSSSYYLSALAVSDSGFLLNLFAVWLEGMMGGVITSDLTCPLVMYLGQVTCFMSVYLTVGFSLERFIAINFPFSRPRICTRSKAKKVIAGISTVALLLFSYAWIIAKVVQIPKTSFSQGCLDEDNEIDATANENSSVEWFKVGKAYTLEYEHELSPIPLYSEVEYRQRNSSSSCFNNIVKNSSCKYMCTVPERYYRISEVANYLDSAVTLIIPLLLITYFNVRIAISVWKLKDQRQHFVASLASSVNSNVVLTVRPELNIARNGQQQLQNGTVPTRKGRFSIRMGGNSGAISPPKRSKSSGNIYKTQGSNHNVCNGKDTKLKRNASLPLRCHQMNEGSPGFRQQYQLQRSASSEVRVTKMLLLVSTVFLVFNLPLHVIRCTQFIQTATGSQKGPEILQALQPWANMLFNTNFAVNFLLYCVSGRNFRKSLQNITSGIFRKESKLNPVQEENRYSLRRK